MNRTITVAPVRKSVLVAAAPARAFEVFTSGLGRWWPASHSINKAPMKEALIEPRVGGRWYERGNDGSECDWGRVLVWEPPTRVVLSWQLDSEWRFNPELHTEVEVRFIAESAEATRVELEHRYLERLGAQAPVLREKVDAPGGWSALLGLYASCARSG